MRDGAPLTPYLIAALILLIILFLPNRLGWIARSATRRVKAWFFVGHQHLEGWQWGCGDLLAVVLHLFWFVPWAWYVQPPRLLGCLDPEERRGLISFWPNCPEPRPYDKLVGISLPIAGVILVSIVTLILLDVSPRRADPAAYLCLGCGVGILSIMGCTFLYIVGR